MENEKKAGEKPRSLTEVYQEFSTRLLKVISHLQAMNSSPELYAAVLTYLMDLMKKEDPETLKKTEANFDKEVSKWSNRNDPTVDVLMQILNSSALMEAAQRQFESFLQGKEETIPAVLNCLAKPPARAPERRRNNRNRRSRTNESRDVDSSIVNGHRYRDPSPRRLRRQRNQVSRSRSRSQSNERGHNLEEQDELED